MDENTGLVPRLQYELARQQMSDVLLQQIRPVWQSRRLIERVKSLLSVDPGSACQSLLNTATHDLREKVLTAGLDIAKEIVKENKLPPIERVEDIEENISARPFVPKDTLTFAASMSKFTRMIGNMEASFLITNSWKAIKKMIE
jgi:uncharacterized protein (DUF2126 family)